MCPAPAKEIDIHIVEHIKYWICLDPHSFHHRFSYLATLFTINGQRDSIRYQSYLCIMYTLLLRCNIDRVKVKQWMTNHVAHGIWFVINRNKAKRLPIIVVILL